MSVCDGSGNMDNEDIEVKQKPMDSDKVKSEEFPPGLESEDRFTESEDDDAQQESGKLQDSASHRIGHIISLCLAHVLVLEMVYTTRFYSCQYMQY